MEALIIMIKEPSTTIIRSTYWVHCIVYSLWKHKVLKFLRVDVVKIIAETFERIGMPVMTVDELDKAVKNDPEVWDLYAKGITMGLNQVEREKSSQRCMKYKPRNLPELGAFVAAIRPGFKSMLNTFIQREHFEYNIPSLDNLLKTKEIPESFLMFDEQILQILKAAGIPGPSAYACTKAIKKKKADKVASFKERFREGFAQMLIEKEHASEEKAEETVEEIWRIINDAAQYMFCSAHSTSMAYDSLYCAWLKAHYPYELYVTMLKLYDEKKNTDKISAIIAEMNRYKGIKLIPGRFGQDNRDWTVDKAKGQISQSLSSIRFMSSDVAEDLYHLGLQSEAEMGVVITPAVLKPEVKKEVAAIKKRLKALSASYNEEISPLMSEEEMEDYRTEKQKVYEEGVELEAKLKEIEENDDSYQSMQQETHVTAPLDCFTNVLRAIQMNTRVKVNQLKILIELNYFSKYGKSGKLMKLYNEFFEGKNSISKTIKSFNQRLDILRQLEKELPDEELPVDIRLESEQSNIGLCLSVDNDIQPNLYFVESVDNKYGIKAKLYSIQRGTTGEVRISKKDYERIPFQEGVLLSMLDFSKRPRCTYRNGERIQIPGEQDCWVTRYSIQYRQKTG